MPPGSQVALEPRKSPVQARSTASVEAILDATVQVLLAIGKDRLTTTRVAARAGVSVGTLYQYFPNKSSLLQAVLKRHLGEVTAAIELVGRQQRGQPLRRMATALITAFLDAKMRHPETSVALYAVSSDVDGAKIAIERGLQTHRTLVAMLETSCDQLTSDPELVAAMIQGAMVGVSRRMLESGAAEKQREALQPQLIAMVNAYLDACSAGR